MTSDNVKILKSDYLPFLKEIKGKIKSARIQAYRRVNKEIILLYWDIGKKIVERQEQFGWGKSIVEKLSADLSKEFPDLSGCSARNLWDMRRLYLEYKDNEKLRRLVAEIPWGQNLVIMYRVKDYREREFYIRKTFEYGWTRDVLIHQIEAGAHLAYHFRIVFSPLFSSNNRHRLEFQMTNGTCLNSLGFLNPRFYLCY